MRRSGVWFSAVVAVLLVVGVDSPGYAQDDWRHQVAFDEVQAILDSLTRVAIDSADTHVVFRLGVLGQEFYGLFPRWSPDGANPRDPAIVGRLARIYDASSADAVQSKVLVMMKGQVERREAVRFLVSVAEAESRGRGTYNRPLPVDALLLLSDMGKLGRDGLQELAARGRVKNTFARQVLADLQQHDWLPKGRRQRSDTLRHQPTPVDTTKGL